jgi:hypothetical protein
MRHGMSKKIYARLDAATESLRNELQTQLGWTDSQIVREGIKSLSKLMRSSRRRQIIGQGQFQSEKKDLGSNRVHLIDFGQ